MCAPSEFDPNSFFIIFTFSSATPLAGPGSIILSSGLGRFAAVGIALRGR